MALSRYSESRTLVRRLCRLPGELPAAFRAKVARLREHFERFNVDTAELCQWLMGLRPGRPGGDAATADFWRFMLEPMLEGVETDETEHDRWRLAAFDHVAGLRAVHELDGRPLPPQLAAAMALPAVRPRTATAERLFARLRTLGPAHRLVLLKSAAEWIVARYQRGVENWERQHDEWEKEKQAWEQRHLKLTAEVRQRFTDVFKALVWDKDKPPGVRNKRPRICLHERLAQRKDNCAYAGQKGHGPLCWKYAEFVKGQKESKSGFNAKFFPDNADKYLLFRKKMNKQHALEQLGQRVPQSRLWFAKAWTAYMDAMGLTEETVQRHGRLSHCLKIGETFEKSQCEWNPHTELCKQYQRAVVQLDDATLKLEPLYREWRRFYLAGPRKPSFRYPSSRELPMPKVFGDRYHEIDFDCSVLRLRLDDMAEPGTCSG